VTDTYCVLAGRYRLDSRIASGGVGDVWRAEDLVLARPVAVKLLRAEYAVHPETLTRFRAEAKHAASLSHEGIAQIYDYDEGGPEDQPFLVMELIDGPSLADVISRGPIAVGSVLDIVAQAALALQAAHESGLVHRDIKPANVLLTSGGRVKITDFGIAYAAGSAPVTRQGLLVGTPAYLAPERVTGSLATPASDLYSLGILAHECLTGRRPFEGTPQEMVLAHGHRDLPPLPDSVPAPVAGFVAALTARDPAARPPTARAAGRRASQLRAGLPAARPATSREPVPKGWPAGNRWASPGQATTAHTQPVTLHGESAGARRDPSWSPAPVRGHRRGRRSLAGPALIAVGACATLAVLGWLLLSSPSHRPAAAGSPPAKPAAASPKSHAADTVAVRPAALIGQPLWTVLTELRDLGLRPVVRWVPPSAQGSAPGMVAYVSPHGRVLAGSPVTVYASWGRDFDAGLGRRGHDNGQGGNY
jgi:eukaryotic-like serine/threonine-protein kinase